MIAPRLLSTLALLSSLTLAGCRLPGKPKDGPEVPRPEAVLAFEPLYAQNCAGCHGVDGQNGAATNLANLEYEALIDDASLRSIIASGEKGTLMPAFGLTAGGSLTDQQVDVLVKGMRTKWFKPNVLAGAPPYHATHPGYVSKGQAVYSAACAQCHGASAQQPGPGGSILDGAFLALINEQTIRTTIIAGRSDLGHPDWRGLMPGRPLTDDEVTDVAAWLIAQTPPRPGHPYPNAQPNTERRGEAQPLGSTSSAH